METNFPLQKNLRCRIQFRFLKLFIFFTIPFLDFEAGSYEPVLIFDET